MGRPRFLAENFFDVDLFASHTVAANQETTGQEAWRVGTARRSGNSWTPTSTNTEAYIGATCDRVRYGDMIALDRGHNLGGKTIRLKGSNDNWSTNTQVFSLTVPTQTYPYSRLESTPGVKTTEGAWLYRFTPHAFKYWRLYIDAMGSGQKPEIVGLYLGLSLQLQHAPPLSLEPWDPDRRELAFESIVSSTLWVGSNRAAQRRRFSTAIRLASWDEDAQVRYHIKELFWRRRFMWAVQDDERAEHAILSFAEAGTHGAPVEGDWQYPVLRLEAVEHQPRVQ